MTNEAYAREIAERWNVKERGSGFVTRFAVRKALRELLDHGQRARPSPAGARRRPFFEDSTASLLTLSRA